jgi:tetratricopeptide (TPR) repeat protein
MDSARPFRAFVSYCHKDKAFAAWLQRRLEGYRLPRRLADKVTPLPGQAPGRIGPVFRDREDLSAATDLSAAVREAIAASSALVVVASPNAAKSLWVAREIDLFRALHPGAPVLVALARGEPHDSLPEALRTGPEPLCADFRKHGDGKRLAFLKIVAGLAYLPLDTLVQRDAQRQVRHVTGVTLGAAVLVVIMGLLLMAALRAREQAERQGAEAERQRSQAERLVEYMLTDLRERLQGVGRLDVMDEVNNRAEAYYVEQGRLPDKSLQLRARVFHAQGADLTSRGDFSRALNKFNKAYAITSDVLARHPADGDAIFMQAQSEYYLGHVAQRRNDRSTATRHWQSYRERAGTLARVEKGSARSFLELGYAEGNLCELNARDSYDLGAAETQCRNAIRFAEKAVHKAGGEAKFVVALANRIGWLAGVQLMRGKSRAAIESRESEAVLLDRLLALDPRNVEYGMRRTWPDIGIANVWLALGRPAKAAEVLAASIERHRAIFGKDSADEHVVETEFRLQLFLAKARRRMGVSSSDNLTRADRLQKALSNFGPESAARAGEIRASIWPVMTED